MMTAVMLADDAYDYSFSGDWPNSTPFRPGVVTSRRSSLSLDGRDGGLLSTDD